MDLGNSSGLRMGPSFAHIIQPLLPCKLIKFNVDALWRNNLASLVTSCPHNDMSEVLGLWFDYCEVNSTLVAEF